MDYTFLYQADLSTLRFLVPNHSQHKSSFISPPDRITRLHLVYDRYAPELLMLREDTIFQDSASSLVYTLAIEENTLKVISCVERDHTGEITLLNSGYPYLIFPDAPDKTTRWSYRLREDIQVDCCSRITRVSTDNTNLQLLYVQRRMCYNDGKVKDAVTITESYLEGSGIQDVFIKSDNWNKTIDL